MSRNFWLLIHRWGGLVMAVPLIIVALTGSVIAFDREMKHWLMPERYATPQPGVPMLDLETLAAKAQALVPPGGRIANVFIGTDYAQASVHPPMDNMAAMQQVWMDKVATMGNMERLWFGISMMFNPPDLETTVPSLPFEPFSVTLDPWTGKELFRDSGFGGGTFRHGVRHGLMQFVHQLHDVLALGMFGNWVLGIIALLWTVDCFISYYLTFPISRRKGIDAAAPGKSWWARWKPAWKVKTGASFYRLNFDLHRANGLWLWPMLFVFAWSSVQFNLPSVYHFVTDAIFESPPPKAKSDWAAQVEMEKRYKTHGTHGEPEPDLKAALTTARKLAAEEAAKRNISLGEPWSYSKQQGTSLAQIGMYLNTPDCAGVSAGVSDRLETKRCRVTLSFDTRTSAFVDLMVPAAADLQNEPTGNFVTRWLRKLHKGQTLGLWYQIFVCILGIVITMLSVTGIYIWWKKHKARKLADAKKSEAALVAEVTQ